MKKKLLAYIEKIKLNYIGDYKYSNLGFSILGLIINQFKINKITNYPTVKGYGSKVLNFQGEYKYIDTKTFYSALGRYVTIPEIINFAQLILKKDTSILSLDSFKNMFKTYTRRKGDLDDICMPWNKWKVSNVFDYTGHTFGFESYLLLDFDLKLGIVVLTNTTEVKASYLGYGIRKCMYLNINDNYKLNVKSHINGFYRSKNYDVIALDFHEKLILIKPNEDNPFNNFEEYKKIKRNVYLTTDEDDPYYNELLTFEMNKSGTPNGFKQGGWGFEKINKLN